MGVETLIAKAIEASLATKMIVAGTSLAAAGQIQAGRVTASEEQSAQNIANYNAAVMEQEAEAIRKKGKFEQVQHAKESARVMSTLEKNLLAQGATGSGLLEEEQEAELELEGLLIGYEAETAARRAESQAIIDRASGRLAGQRGKSAKKAGYLGAGATLLTGFGMAGMGGGGGGGGGGGSGAVKLPKLTPREKFRFRSGGALSLPR